jgi:hypothetical protein
MSITHQRRKLRIGTIWRAAGFPFKNIIPLFKLGFFPMLIAAAVIYPAVQFIQPENVPLNTPEAAAQFIGSLWKLWAVSSLIMWFLVAIVGVGIHRLIILGERPGWTIIPLRPYEGAYVLLLLIVAAISFLQHVIFIVLLGLMAPGNGLSGAIEALADPLIALRIFQLDFPVALKVAVSLLMIVFIWLYLRLALVFPHAAVTGSIAPGLSWQATRGNLWRLILAFLLLGIIVLLILLVLVFIGGFVFAAIVDAMGGMQPQQPGQALQSADVFRQMLISLAVGIPVTGVMFASFAAFMSHAYSQLVSGEEPAAAEETSLGAVSAAP